jgi:hypothetical protein
MTQLTPHQIEKAKILKAARSAIRLKHSLMADEEMYNRLPELERRIDQALNEGKELKLTTSEILDDHGK